MDLGARCKQLETENRTLKNDFENLDLDSKNKINLLEREVDQLRASNAAHQKQIILLNERIEETVSTKKFKNF